MPTERRYQIFVSSTYRDLKSERDKLLRTLAEFNYIPAGMEYFPAIDEEQFKFIKKVIDESDYYVVILGGLYGSIASDGKSYSEKEYEYALERKMPVCALLRENHQLLPAEKREADQGTIQLFENFRKRLAEGRLVSFWNDENELSLKLVQSLSVTAKTYPAPGWVRGGPEEPLELLRKIQSIEAENSELRSELGKLKEATESISEELRAFLRSEFEVNFTHHVYSGHNAGDRKAALKLTWAEIAEYVLPKMVAPLTVKRLKSHVDHWIHEQTGRESVNVQSDTTDSIKLMLSAFNLISNYSAQNVGGGLVEFLEVTPLGTRVSTMLKLGKLGLQATQ